MIFARLHGLPVRKQQAWNLALARGDPGLVLVEVRANDFDVDVIRARAGGNRLPFVSSERDWVAAIGDDAVAEGQVVLRDAIRQPVALSLDLDLAEVAQCLLEGVNPEPEAVRGRREVPGKRGFAHAGASGKDK